MNLRDHYLAMCEEAYRGPDGSTLADRLKAAFETCREDSNEQEEKNAPIRSGRHSQP